MAEKEYIERGAALEALRYYYGCSVEVECDPDCIVTECAEGRIIMALPAADVAPVVHAEWEWFEEWRPSTPEAPRECEDCGWRCGKCKDALEDMVGGYWDNPEEKPKLNYCPHCGAKMDGGRKHD